MNKKISKTIHYIWLGKNKKSDNFDLVYKSWQEFAKGFEIKEWNEDNISEFDLPDYFCYLMKCKKWAFASDILRVYILDKYGGVYLDIDQVLVKDINILWDKFLNNDIEFFVSTYHQVNNYYGFGFIGSSKGFIFNQKMKDFYLNISKKNYKNFFIINKIGSEIINNLLKDNIYKNKIKIFSQDFFYPLQGYCEKTENTFSYHLSNVSWQPKWKKFLYKFKFYFWFKNLIIKIIPRKILRKLGFNIEY